MYDMYGDGTGQKRKRTAQQPVAPPRPTVAELLAAQVAAEQSANAQQVDGPPLATNPALPAPAATPNTSLGLPASPAAPAPTNSPVHIGARMPETMSPLGRKLAEYRATQQAGLGSKVRETDWGFEELPPTERTPSRLKKGLEGFLTGAAIAGANGPAEGALARFLGGGLAGGIAGVAKPKLVQQFGRDQELAKLQGDITTDQGIEARNAGIAETEAQTQQRLAQPELDMLRIQRQLDNDAALQADRTADNTRAEAALKETKRTGDMRAAADKERERHNLATEKKGSPKRVWSHNGQFWEEDDNGVMRAKKGSPPPTPSASADRATQRGEAKTAKGKQAASLYQKGSEYWDQAQAKRKEAAALSGKKYQTDAEVATIARLNREAEGLESKTRDVQLQGDKLAAEADSTSEPAAAPATRRAFNLGAWKADHPDASPAEIEAKRKQYSDYRIVE